MLVELRRRLQSAQSDVSSDSGAGSGAGAAGQPVPVAETGRVQAVQLEAVRQHGHRQRQDAHPLAQSDVRPEHAQEEDHSQDRRQGHRVQGHSCQNSMPCQAFR